jgi:hypothetical protein
VAARAPYWLLYHAARLGGGLHYCLARGKRRNYLANTSKVIRFGSGCRPWHAFQNHALNVVELLRAVSLGQPHLDDFLTIENLACLDRALARGSGVILATYHAGNWELFGLYLAMKGYPITTVAGEQLSGNWSNHVKGFKERYGIELVAPGRGLRSLYLITGHEVTDRVWLRPPPRKTPHRRVFGTTTPATAYTGRRGGSDERVDGPRRKMYCRRSGTVVYIPQVVSRRAPDRRPPLRS